MYRHTNIILTMQTGAERWKRSEASEFTSLFIDTSTNQNAKKIYTMQTGNERAMRSEAIPLYTDMSANMSANMISTMQTGAERAGRSEAREATPCSQK